MSACMSACLSVSVALPGDLPNELSALLLASSCIYRFHLLPPAYLSGRSSAHLSVYLLMFLPASLFTSLPVCGFIRSTSELNLLQSFKSFTAVRRDYFERLRDIRRGTQRQIQEALQQLSQQQSAVSAAAVSAIGVSAVAAAASAFVDAAAAVVLLAFPSCSWRT